LASSLPTHYYATNCVPLLSSLSVAYFSHTAISANALGSNPETFGIVLTLLPLFIRKDS
jgi:hypothetical protein